MFSASFHWKRIIFITSIVLIALGTGVIIYFGVESFSAYREIRYARMHYFNTEYPDTFVVRPWMSIRYVSSSYRMPEEYLFQHIGIPMTQKNSLTSFRMLNSIFHIGPEDDISILLNRVQAAIDLFQAKVPPPPDLPGHTGALLQPPQGSAGHSSSS